MNSNQVKSGLKVRITKLGETNGMLIMQRHLDCRREGAIGIVDGYVPGHGGDVWWVKHEDSDDIGAYVFDEMEITE